MHNMIMILLMLMIQANLLLAPTSNIVGRADGNVLQFEFVENMKMKFGSAAIIAMASGQSHIMELSMMQLFQLLKVVLT